MKKFFAVLLSLCLLCGTFALAEDNTISGDANGEKTANTVVTTTVEESYTITIPPEVLIPFESTGITTQSVAVTAYNLLSTHKLSVRYTSANGLKMMNGASSIPYIMLGIKPDMDYDTTGKATWNLAVKVSETNGDSTAKIQEIWKNAKAGTYSDMLTFTVKIVDR